MPEKPLKRRRSLTFESSASKFQKATDENAADESGLQNEFIDNDSYSINDNSYSRKKSNFFYIKSFWIFREIILKIVLWTLVFY